MAKNKPGIPAGLVFFEGLEKPRQYVIFQKAVIRGQQEMDVFTPSALQLSYPFLDPEQCEIRYEDGKWIYRNLSENTFTFVGGKALPTGEERELGDHTVIRLSNDRMVTAVFLKEFASSTDWQIINMDDGRHVVVIIDEAAEGRSAMTLEYENSRWWLKEIGVGSLKLNGQECSEGTALQFDDCLQIGSACFIFEGSGLLYSYRTSMGGLTIQIDERSVHNAMKKVVLLKDINLSVEPGNMVLILGGSGAGKSTFVNAVTGYEKADATITEGGVDYYKHFAQVKHRIGFVPQQNLMREEDTVLYTVRNAADLRLPADMPDEDKDRRVRMVLETFGLTGRESTLVSKLSGGQKKRLSICTEFVASPNLFILDEPDSGLDGIMAIGLMENLRLIACQGKMVMVITHAPDRVAHLFDKVIVLAKGTENKIGQLAFYGEIPEALEFFGTDSLENVVKRINAVNEGGEGRADEFIEKYKEYAPIQAAREKNSFRESGAEIVQEAPPVAEEGEKVHYKSRLGQIPIFLGKHLRMFITEGNWKVLPLSALIAFLVVYVIGRRMFINMEGTSYAAFAVTCVCLWNGVFNSIQVVCKERGIIKREHRAGLHISSYLISHMIYQAMICLVQVLMTSAIFVIFKVHLPAESAVTGSFLVDMIITMFLITYAADMMGLMISCIVHTPMTAMTVMPMILIVQLVFADFVIPLNAMGKKLSNLTISKWGIQSISSIANYNAQESSVLLTALNTMKNKDPDSLVSKVQRVLSIDEVNHKVGQLTASQLQNEAYAFSSNNILKNWLILAAFIAAFILIGLVFLEMVDKDKR